MNTQQAFNTLLDRVQELTLDLERERQLRAMAENRPSAALSKLADVIEFGRAVKADELIHAIKAYRTLTGCSLVDSKDAVERVMKRGQYLEHVA